MKREHTGLAVIIGVGVMLWIYTISTVIQLIYLLGYLDGLLYEQKMVNECVTIIREVILK